MVLEVVEGIAGAIEGKLVISLAAGEVLDLRVDQNTGGNLTTLAAANASHIFISRLFS